MYFQKSVDIASAHLTIAKEVAQVDELIYTIGDHPIRPDQLSDSLDIEQSLLVRILGLYATAGTLRRETRRYCGNCEALIDEQNNPKECDNCEAKFSKAKPDDIEVFTPVNPVIRAELDVGDGISEPVPVCIQFVGGDRGGGQKHQLQIPKEFGSIKCAIKAADHSERLELADPVFAAKMDDLCTLYTEKPRLIHFAGNGDDRSLSFIKDQDLLASTVKVTAGRLGKILQEFPIRVSVVVFNVCDSAAMAENNAGTGAVDIAIGWEGKVPDSVAITFAQQFYTHIGNCLSVGSAFVLAAECAAPEDAAYRGLLFSRSGVDPKTYYLLTP
ncbi:MAG TPA: hypothetical protein PK867_01500 [Pirellulales bacterium]|nr:hypothetical protein [Pirellulales bacterium]